MSCVNPFLPRSFHESGERGRSGVRAGLAGELMGLELLVEEWADEARPLVLVEAAVMVHIGGLEHFVSNLLRQVLRPERVPGP